MGLESGVRSQKFTFKAKFKFKFNIITIYYYLEVPFGYENYYGKINMYIIFIHNYYMHITHFLPFS